MLPGTFLNLLNDKTGYILVYPPHCSHDRILQSLLDDGTWCVNLSHYAYNKICQNLLSEDVWICSVTYSRICQKPISWCFVHICIMARQDARFCSLMQRTRQGNFCFMPRHDAWFCSMMHKTGQDCFCFIKKTGCLILLYDTQDRTGQHLLKVRQDVWYLLYDAYDRTGQNLLYDKTGHRWFNWPDIWRGGGWWEQAR